ncbi:glycine zipper family protein [Vibrio parahaemolyticus]|uniref:glycine zipper family protein n=1 Tax=Vibrio mediterranei TaxID=689 RepID=UPI0040684C47
MKYKTSIALLLFVTFSASSNVIVDTKNVDQEKYHADMYECQQYSQQVDANEGRSGGSGLLGSTAKGAALGAAGTAIAGGRGTKGAQVGAGIGLIGGALKHSSEKKQKESLYQSEQESVVRNCLQGRGYTLLN